jgi:hypothetical protein
VTEAAHCILVHTGQESSGLIRQDLPIGTGPRVCVIVPVTVTQKVLKPDKRTVEAIRLCNRVSTERHGKGPRKHARSQAQGSTSHTAKDYTVLLPAVKRGQLSALSWEDQRQRFKPNK